MLRRHRVASVVEQFGKNAGADYALDLDRCAMQSQKCCGAAVWTIAEHGALMAASLVFKFPKKSR
jgi:hypothetical protein